MGTNHLTPPDCPGPPLPTAPRRPLPARSCDTHLHVLGPYAKYPLAEKRAYTVPEATLDMLQKYMQVMGIDRAVIAHVSAAGHEMAVTLDAMASLGQRARGTMMPIKRYSSTEMNTLHDQGMRGMRLSNTFGYTVSRESLDQLASQIGDRPWHIAIWPEASDLDLFAALPTDFPIPIVLDHLAARWWFPEGRFDAAAFDLLRRLLGEGRAWLKLSGPMRGLTSGYPWPEVLTKVAQLVAEMPDRLLWASDWPHVGLTTEVMPHSGQLIDWLDDLGASEAVRNKILVSNPEGLYGFN